MAVPVPAMKKYREVDVYFHSFLTSALHAVSGQLDAAFSLFLPGETLRLLDEYECKWDPKSVWACLIL